MPFSGEKTPNGQATAEAVSAVFVSAAKGFPQRVRLGTGDAGACAQRPEGGARPMQKRTMRAQNGAGGRGRKGSLWRLAAADAGRRNRANETWLAYRKEALCRKNLRVRGGDCRHLIQCFCTRLRLCAGCGQTADGQGKTAAPDFLLHGGIPTVSRLFASLSR